MYYFSTVEKDYLLLGQGIAGSVLSFVLLQQGKNVLVIDENPEFTASKVAAGLYNPIVFKRIVKSWKVDEVLPYANSLYSEMEVVFKRKIHQKREIVKLFSSLEEKSFWEDKSTHSQLSNYLSKEINENFYPNKINNPFACSFVKQSGNVDAVLMLQLMKEYLLKINAYREEKFDFKELLIGENGVEWKGIRAKKIIFCEGYKTLQNPYFNWLPFVLTKGEVLIIRMENFDTEKVINKGVFILPLGNNLFKVGATYEWKELTEAPSIEGKNELLEKLRRVIRVQFEVISHLAGIRPTVIDRRPIIGLHPKHSQLGIFNGMGTKAVLLAPYFAREYAGFLAGTNGLEQDVDCSRFESYL